MGSCYAANVGDETDTPSTRDSKGLIRGWEGWTLDSRERLKIIKNTDLKRKGYAQ